MISRACARPDRIGWDWPDPRAGMTAKHVLLFGATGTAGQGALRALLDAGHDVTCFVRSGSAGLPDHVTRCEGDLTDRNALIENAFSGRQVDAVVSCLASRTGAPKDAWAIDHQAHSQILAAAQQSGVGQFVLLSAICVQKPVLAFQHAKLAFETELMTSGLVYSIVRPTAFFKSLSGQVERVKAGKPYLIFGDGTLTACKPISDRDLGKYIARCLNDPDLQNRILPIGGPGPALTPRAQGELLFDILKKPPRFRSVPVAMLTTIGSVLTAVGHIRPSLADKAEFARTGRYYAIESMLVWDPERQAYDAQQTPEFGTETLGDHFAALLSGALQHDKGAHSVF